MSASESNQNDININMEKIDDCKLSELKDFCKQYKIYVKSTARKGEIIEAIKEWESNGRQSDVKPRGRGRPTGSSNKIKPKRESEDSDDDEKSDEKKAKDKADKKEKKEKEKSDEKKEKKEKHDKLEDKKSEDKNSNRALSPERIDSKSVRSLRGRQDNRPFADNQDQKSPVIETEFEKSLKLEGKMPDNSNLIDDSKMFKSEIKKEIKDYSIESIMHLFSLSSYIMETCANEIDFHMMNSFYPKMNLHPETILEKCIHQIEKGNLNDIYFDLCYRLGYSTLNAKYVRNMLQFKSLNKLNKFDFDIRIEDTNGKTENIDSKIVYMACRDEVVSSERRETYFESHLQNTMKDFCECNELLPRDVGFDTVYQHFNNLTSKYRNQSEFNTEICLLFNLGNLEIDASSVYVKDVMDVSICKYSDAMEKINALNMNLKSSTDFESDSRNNKFMFVRVIRPYSAFSDGRIIPNRFKLGKYVINFDNSIIM